MAYPPATLGSSGWNVPDQLASPPIRNSETSGGEDVSADVQKVETRGKYAVIKTATTTLVKTGPGNIHSIRVIGGTLGNVSVFDDTAASAGEIVPVVTPDKGQVLVQDVAFATGLSIVTAAATILLVSYR